jgi:hypothetical protein
VRIALLGPGDPVMAGIMDVGMDTLLRGARTWLEGSVLIFVLHNKRNRHTENAASS